MPAFRGLGRATGLELRKALSTRTRRWLLIAAGVIGLLTAGVVALAGSAEDHTFSAISFYTQSAISLPLPLVSVLLMTQDFGPSIVADLGSGLSLDVILPRNCWPA